jgi:hypothetical protein
MELYRIIREAKMSPRPEYYSGRGATQTDLPAASLKRIYELIKYHHGDDAAENFCHMVFEIPKLSATEFLLALYGLEARGWKWSPKSHQYRGGIYPGDIGSAMMTVVDVLCGSLDRDDTHAIRLGFFSAIGDTKRVKRIRDAQFPSFRFLPDLTMPYIDPGWLIGNEWVSRNEIARRLGILPNSVRRRVNAGSVERKREGGKNFYRISTSSLTLEERLENCILKILQKSSILLSAPTIWKGVKNFGSEFSYVSLNQIKRLLNVLSKEGQIVKTRTAHRVSVYGNV